VKFVPAVAISLSLTTSIVAVGVVWGSASARQSSLVEATKRLEQTTEQLKTSIDSKLDSIEKGMNVRLESIQSTVSASQQQVGELKIRMEQKDREFVELKNKYELAELRMANLREKLAEKGFKLSGGGG
jgi:chromosome segregation ATPase